MVEILPLATTYAELPVESHFTELEAKGVVTKRARCRLRLMPSPGRGVKPYDQAFEIEKWQVTASKTEDRHGGKVRSWD